MKKEIAIFLIIVVIINIILFATRLINVMTFWIILIVSYIITKVYYGKDK